MTKITTHVKLFIELSLDSDSTCSGANITKLFTAVIYECSEKARVFLHDGPFQPSLTFASNAVAYPQEATFRCLFRVSSWPYLQTLEKAVNKHSSFLRAFVNYSHKKICNIGPR